VVVTDGYHFTKPLELVCHHLHVYYFKIVCAIDDTQLLAGCCVLVLFYLMGFVTGIFILRLLSLFPIPLFSLAVLYQPQRIYTNTGSLNLQFSARFV
jgi:hypothetical protein